MIKYNYSNHFIDNYDKKNVLEALNSKKLTKGKYLNIFESKIKKIVNAKYCIAMTNASCALIAALKSLNIKKNDVVWCSDNTYIATINCALHLNSKIDLVDISLKDFNICVNSLKHKLLNTSKKKLPKFLIITHIAGYPCDLKEIYKLSKKYKFKIVEDASHAIGAKYYKDRIGNCKYSELAVFSFHPAKIITSAEGGAITTNNLKVFKKLQYLRENGHDFSKNKYQNIDVNYYNIKELGFNFRLNELNCALGASQLNKLKKFINYKNKLAKNYFLKLNKKKFIFPKYNLLTKSSSWHLFIIRLNFQNMNKSKNNIINFLKKSGILVKTHYPPLSTFTLIKKKISASIKHPNVKEYYKSAFSIPIYYGLTFKDQKKIIKILNKV
tara:strand:- start:5524 stop:6675 length:1152 start_codon:yes stop_codon:yes gene_type:complete